MKKTVTIFLSVFFLAAFSVSAQMHQGQSEQKDQKQGMMMQKSDMMQGGMMQGMMNKGMCPMCGQMMNQDMPMQKYIMMVNHLPNMQQQLSLDDNQMDQLYDLQDEFKKQQIDYQSVLRKKQMKLKSLLDEMTPASQVEKQMQDCANTKISMKVAAYETAGKMKAVLNTDQKKQLKSKMMQMHGQGGMMNQGQDGLKQKSDDKKQDEHNH